MSVFLVVGVLLGVFFLLMFLGLPVALAFIAANLSVLFLHSGTRFFSLIAVGMFNSLNSFVLIAVPLFIIMGEVMVRCRFVDLITDVSESIFGKLRAQDAILTVGTGTVLAALSGAPIATGATLGSTMVPRMIDNGYAKWFAAGAALGGASLATLIPPSSLAIILATLAEVSPTRVLIGGIVPGLICSFLFIVFILISSRIWPHLAPAVPEGKNKSSKREIVVRILRAAPLLLIVFLVVGVIFLGIATATEAAALGALGTILLGFAYKRMSWRILKDTLVATVKMTSMLFLILSASSIFGRVLTLTGAGGTIVNAIVSAPVPPIVVILIMIGSILLLGCVMDAIAMMMITVPLYVPAVIALGFDPLWFCVLVLITTGVAGLTPPVGMVLYALKGATDKVDMKDVYLGGAPYFTIEILVILLLMAFPALGLWLPNLI
ncbi:MAG: TRAP transporter large permease [Firmicutes bacterium]|nr:TRAP transporter large permease [Bacillota bacterium]